MSPTRRFAVSVLLPAAAGIPVGTAGPAAAPGDVGFTGGRWQVHGLALPDGYSVAVAAGDLDGDGVLDSAA